MTAKLELTFKHKKIAELLKWAFEKGLMIKMYPARNQFCIDSAFKHISLFDDTNHIMFGDKNFQINKEIIDKVKQHLLEEEV